MSSRVSWQWEKESLRTQIHTLSTLKELKSNDSQFSATKRQAGHAQA